MALLYPGKAQESFERISRQKYALGTEITITLYGNHSSNMEKAIDLAFALIDSMDLVFSDYNPDSETYILNQTRKNKPVQLSQPLFELLKLSLSIASRTEGAFDPTLGRLTSLWRTYQAKDKLPPRRKINKRSKVTGYQYVKLDQEKNMATFIRPKIQLDFGGIAKGYIGELIQDLLDSLSLKRHLIDMGGDLIIGEKPKGQRGWPIQLQGCDSVINVENTAIAGSGATFQFIQKNGQTYGHILGPEEKQGVTRQQTTMVFGSQGAWTDAMATAVHASDENKWLTEELIPLGNSYFIQKADSVFLNYFNTYIRNQLKGCL